MDSFPALANKTSYHQFQDCGRVVVNRVSYNMFYNQNQNFSQIPQNQVPNFNKNASNFQGNFNNQNSPNINYFNHFQQQQHPIYQNGNNSQQNDLREDFPTNMNKNSSQNYSGLQSNIKSGTGRNRIKNRFH